VNLQVSHIVPNKTYTLSLRIKYAMYDLICGVNYFE